jgi:N-terminal domain of galactosyltransferase
VPEVSVVIPLFGTHRGWETISAVCSSWLAQEVSCEVIVAVAGERRPELPADRSVRVVRADQAVVSPGVLRNVAALHAKGAWLYLSDADVRPVGADFLARACELADGSALVQPWMYRLVDSADPGDGPWLRGLSTQRSCFLGPGAAPDDEPVVCADERFMWDGDDLMVVPPDDLLDDGGPAELRWRSPFHWGGALVKRALFEAVGGYCADYVGWGCEDDDLVAKLASAAKASVAWRVDPTLRCLHYEHRRPYGTPGFTANQMTLTKRLANGGASMIEADVRARHGRVAGE